MLLLYYKIYTYSLFHYIIKIVDGIYICFIIFLY